MAFLESPRFPGCPKFGYTASPRYSVTISKTASGRERRNRNWARPLYRYDLTVGPSTRGEDEIQELLEFWHAVGGTEVGFRFKDWADYKTSRVNEDVSMLDQVLTLSGGSPGGYQLIKEYTAGVRTQQRTIYKPVSGTILLANNGVLMTPGSQYAVDYATGIVTLFVAANGPITWGGEFDVPVRFDSEFPIELSGHQIETVSFAVTEIRDPSDEA